MRHNHFSLEPGRGLRCEFLAMRHGADSDWRGIHGTVPCAQPTCDAQSHYGSAICTGQARMLI